MGSTNVIDSTHPRQYIRFYTHVMGYPAGVWGPCVTQEKPAAPAAVNHTAKDIPSCMRHTVSGCKGDDA